MVEEQEQDDNSLPCQFLPNYIGKRHTCIVEGFNIDHTTEIKGCHDKKESTVMRFSKCELFQFPAANSVLKHIPHLRELVIFKSDLPPITKDDFAGFGCLNSLKIEFCNLKELPGNLFENTPNLEWIYFDNNEIMKIGEDILEPLINLKFFLLSNNPGIDAEYRSFNWIGSSLEEFKEAIKNCGKPCTVMDILIRTHFIEDFDDETATEEEDDSSFNASSRDTSFTLFDTFMNESSIDDFAIIVNEKSFKVNKRLLMEKSVKMAQLLQDDENTNSIELQGVTQAAASAIAQYLKSDFIYVPEKDFIELFDAIYHLEINDLKKSIKNKVHGILNPQNALDVLLLCIKYELGGKLQTKAFIEFTKNFPDKTFSPTIAFNPEKLKQLMKAKLNGDEIMEN